MLNVNIKEIKKFLQEARKEKQENKSTFGDDRSSANTKKILKQKNRPNESSFHDLKWMLSAYATIASFYNAIGN